MNRQELSAMLHAETESIACMLKNEFMKTDTRILSHAVFAGQFNYMQVLLDIAVRNNTIIAKIKNELLLSAKREHLMVYRPDFIERICLNHFILSGIRVHSTSGMNRASFEDVCNEIISQQQIIRELDTRSRLVDISKRNISCCCYGLVNISIPGVLYCLIIQQKKQFMSARHILRLQ